ncbi:hypothetical protein A2W54_01605 [Candidatus Giovannonibacteria bacterium RIFCSPHIGHO2_02_43_13]|uniref:ComEC/Rec2-related protein domain-containing protein n=1 Tax=Candidatus Giovannonibacteria bacterium RIFCSPHIGHO2_02_43_13 TaxID=1798330 RepID=A0A1F5WUT2_9BACT|nr:MAG: ComEC/Rec2-related protein [Parcubacteria group bacterium GW2011_GWA2_44_13]OGF74134.1 MAG: hypothetical protein A3E06_02155 [Candidatus Giovannonibacteria bacterium RIFCSPHIGHO2_12_FULL_44_42]OGF79408.1 MAG: hypothetical protein A2W54_01605 [Candidatus Giovannonibacteria bacterium RIFCSPHIGHO2_02_43_13]OGF89506.1 MAG: hypothetical protein A3I94_02745 [Candidatus Giovannonibacteria bacterium RIFCSPLOWO2_02_FULL_43_54]OGF96724.1 MAG: hypothetical protein A3H08_01035 [Candidatus Giovannon
MSHKAYFNTPLFILAFLTGVAFRSFFNLPNWAVLAGVGLAFGFRLAFFIASVSGFAPARIFSYSDLFRGRDKEFSGLLVWLLIFFLLGILRFSFFENNIAEDKLHEHYGEEITLTGTVISSENKENSARAVLETDLGRLRITKRIYPEYKYGDILEVSGKITEPVNFADFDVKKYLAKDGIYAEMIFPEILDLAKAQTLQDLAQPDEASRAIPQQRDMRVLAKFGVETKRALFSIKEKFEKNLRNILPEPHASLADGMLLGGHGALDEELLNDFKRTGTVHILVLSGYNITIVGAFVMVFFGFFLPEAIGWIAAILAILFFTLMSGAEAAAVRSAIMAVIGLVALHAGRKNAAMLALMWAALLMVLWNPMLMRFDRGFQLSFLATLGLIVASPFFKKVFKFFPNIAGFRENAASSFAAQIFVLPLLLSWGGEISWLSPLANILIVSAVPVIMLFSFLGGLAAFASAALGKIIAGAAYLLVSYQIYLVRFFGSLDFSILQFSFIPMAILGMIYLLLFYWSARQYVKNN